MAKKSISSDLLGLRYQVFDSFCASVSKHQSENGLLSSNLENTGFLSYIRSSIVLADLLGTSVIQYERSNIMQSGVIGSPLPISPLFFLNYLEEKTTLPHTKPPLLGFVVAC